jgi:hypothetical protein
MEKKIKQWEAVVEAMRSMGGVASLGQLNQEVFKIGHCDWNTKTPFASIRRIVQQTPKFIYKIRPGLYGLTECQKQLEANGYIVETEKNKSSKAVQDFTHSYYQGILLELGNMKHYETFVPNQDKNKRYNTRTTLGDVASLPEIPDYTYPDKVKRSSTIDVIWFNDRFPNIFYEVEHSTDIQNSLLKYVDLKYFYVYMFIVADEKRELEFIKKMSNSAFSSIKKRVEFVSYKKLIGLYNAEVNPLAELN